ncbi:MraY family glycosyltransferase [Algisphaera agarilytica]|uniref:UDP-GlcNAc:undecaprenyl-phosphate GlcNAc-1-phosphate transferase n=1 Tax=Algisphaera agarilytica TaxID=1385975 RepID=A0A7X0H6D2_9BACT|nr:MraY family glycosyltransferase [Algisphaera agarilytica]MBB6428931.1 UDP-GlcNAc:undecaprenyl-phosphate GlcNAc-1-phosphate transferase [Algisphaera agarilytica]
MVWIIFALGFVALLISVPLCLAVRRMSEMWGLVDQAGTEAHKLALLPGRQPIANTGGVALFCAIAWPMVGVLLGVWLVPSEVWEQLPGVGENALVTHLPGLQETTKLGGGLLVALAVLHVMGLVDDRRALGAWPKLAVQLAVATGLVVLADVRVLSFLGNPEAGGGTLGLVASIVVSVLWIAVITNAMNFLDNMDGLAAGVGIVVGSLYLAATLIAGQWFVAGLAALLVGGLLGFMLFNFPPARLYLGDGGSLLVGLMLAVISVRTTYVVPGAEPGVLSGPGTAWYGVMMPVLVLAVPLYDFTSVTVMRLLAGKSPFQGDHNHFSHRLLRKGLSKRKALTVILLSTLATGLGGVMLGRLEGWQAVLVAVQAGAVLAVLALLESGKRG